MKKRVFAVLLCVMVMMTVLPTMGVSANEQITSAAKDLLGAYHTWKYVDFEPNMDKAAFQTEGLTLSENGLELTNATWTLTTKDIAPMGTEGYAMEMRMKTGGEGFIIRAIDADGNCVWTSINSNTCWFNVGDGKALYKKADELINQWITVLIINRGAGYDMYCRTDDAEGYGEPLFSSENKRARNNSKVLELIAGSGNVNYVDYVKLYRPGEGKTVEDILGGYSARKTIDFTVGMTGENTADHTITANGLELNNAGEIWESSAINPAPMGTEGYAMEMRMKTGGSGFTVISGVEGTGRLYTGFVENGSFLNISSGAVHAQSKNEQLNQWITVLYVNNGNGFDVYYKPDGVEEYGTPLFSSTSRMNGTANTIKLLANNAGTNYVDYIKFYQPEKAYTYDELIGDCNVRRKIDFKPGMDKAAAGINVQTVTEDGLLLSIAEPSDTWLYTSNPSPMGNAGDAVEMRIKTSGDGFLIKAHDASGGRVYSNLAAGDNGCWFNINGSALYKTQEDIFNNWITILLVNNGDGFSMYYKKDNAERYTELFKGVSKNSGYGRTLEIKAENVGTHYIDYVKMYKKTKQYSISDLLGSYTERETIDFVTDMDKSEAGIPEDSTITNDGLELVNQASAWRLTRDTAPLGCVGDAVEMRVKLSGDGFRAIIGASSEGRLYSQLKKGDNGCYLAMANNKALYATTEDLFNQWVTILWVNHSNGFDMYYKTDDDENYGDVFFRGTSKKEGRINDLELYAEDGDKNYVDYIRMYESVYGGLVINDGADTTDLANGAALTNPDNMNVKVLPGTTGTIIFAVYDAEGGLLDIMTQAISSSDGQTISFDATENLGAKSVSVFVWDTLDNMKPALRSRMVNISQ